jgi:transmembrane sensor
MDYSQFETEDFASDDTFIRWVLHADPTASRFWEDYRLHHPGLEHKIDEARLLLLNVSRAEQTFRNPGQSEKTWHRIQGRIQKKPAQRAFSFFKIAASIALFVMFTAACIVSLRYFSGNESLTEGTQLYEDDFVEEVNRTDRTMLIQLSDGTTVRLAPRSRLKYAYDFKSKPYRKVYLTGEAFFEVAKNLQQPFYVYANEVVTKVLGTSFRVKAYDDERNIVVSVKEGRVSVYSEKSQEKTQDARKPELNGVVLMPNQQVLYKRTDQSFNKSLVETPAMLKEPGVTYSFNFSNTPVRKVFDVLTAAYGVEIIFNDELMKNCYLTAPLGNEPLFEKLDIICRTIGASYELIDAKVVISTRGCNETVDP